MSSNLIYTYDCAYDSIYSNKGMRDTWYNHGNDLLYKLQDSLFAMRYNPPSYHNVDYYSNLLNAYNTMTSPYAYSRTIPGTNTSRYAVMDVGTEHIMNGLQTDYMKVAMDKCNSMSEYRAVEINANLIKFRISNIMGMASWVNCKSLSDESKAQAKAVVEKCKIYEQLLEKYLKNEEKLSASQISSVLSSLLEKIKAFDEEVAALDAQLKEEAKEADAAKADELANGVDEKLGNAGDAGGDTGDGGSSSTTSVAGDTKMSNAQLANRYGLKAPVISEISLVNVNNILNSASTKGSFETNGLTALDNKNTISFLLALSDEQISSFVKTIDGQSFWSNDDEISMKAFLDKFDGALDLLKSSGFLSKDEYNQAVKLIFEAKKAVKDSFTDGARNTIVDNLKKLKQLLAVSISGKETVPVGSQEHFNSLVQEKQKDASKNAIAELRRDYAESTRNSATPSTYDQTLTYAALPDEITYLPNRNVFQVKLEGKTFVGKDFGELNRKIMRCKDESIITNWLDMKKELLSTSGVVSGDAG